jgi:hypothetical protein
MGVLLGIARTVASMSLATFSFAFFPEHLDVGGHLMVAALL